MRLKALTGLLMVLAVLTWSTCPALARAVLTPQTSAASQADPISGVWDVKFMINGDAHPATFNLKLDKATVTGTAFSEHTGAGTVRGGGWWSEGTLSFTLDFKKHESIVIKGTLKEGKLVGEFTTEGFTSNWEATKTVIAVCAILPTPWDSARHFVTKSRLYAFFVNFLSAVVIANTST